MAEPVAKLAAAEHDLHEVEAHMEKIRAQHLSGVGTGARAVGGLWESHHKALRIFLGEH
jgi:hypothetical protein